MTASTQDNPLLQIESLPDFPRISPEHVTPALERQLEDNRALIEQLTAAEGADSDDDPAALFARVVIPLEQARQRLSRVWSPVSHLNAVMNSEALREAYNECLAKLTGYATELAQNEALCALYNKILARDEAVGGALDASQRRLIEEAVRDFRLSGVDLPAERKARFRELMRDLSAAQSTFEENVLDATNAFSYTTADRDELAGLPDHVIARAAEQAREAGDGTGSTWRFVLDFPTYQAVVTHADHAPLRKRFYEAWSTRASDQGPQAGEWDNTQLMGKILRLRAEVAALTGFAHYAEYSLATKMAESVDQVIDFLEDLAARSLPAGRREFEALEEFAGTKLEAWDVAWAAERVRQERFDISDEMLRPYFPLERVISGMFALVERLFGIRVRADDSISGWHPDSRFYLLETADGTARGGFYVDLFARRAKRGGAWMDECVVRAELEGRTELPVAYLVCNFTPASGDAPAQLSHNEVITLFHEFGHSLHHMLTRVGYPSLAGINGVPWDAVELPSQFLENFAWDPAVIEMISGHVQTGAPLPEELLDRLIASRTFGAGMAMLRQLEFALFDMRLHAGQAPKEHDEGRVIAETLAQVREAVSVVPVPEFNRFPCSFSHIFAGGYAAGYYSYKWAEVLSADAFSAFEEEGVLSTQTGQRWLQNVLEVGGTRDAMEAFVGFRGRAPSSDALLRHSGLGG
ncbi:MAG: M3 family metallopeptidase [Pseudomonadota bacterium]